MSSSRLGQLNVSTNEPLGQLPALEIQEIVAGDERILRLTGDLDLVGVPPVEQTLRRASGGPASTVLVLDLSGLNFIDSSGLRAVLLARDLCSRAGYEFRLIPGPHRVQRVFEITGLDAVLPFAT